MPHTLLLADDSVTIQRVIELTFADEDITVITVGDGRQAIQRVQSERPDIVLADISMPELDGYEVAAFIKGTPEFAHIPVLLLTGAFDPIDEGRARAGGCDGVLVKPFEPQLVISRVKDLIRGRPVPVGAGPLSAPHTPRPTTPDGSVEDYFDRLHAALSSLDSAQSSGPTSEAPIGRQSSDARPPLTVSTADQAAPGYSGLAEELAGWDPHVAPAFTPAPIDAPLESVSLADAFASLLAAEQGRASSPASGWTRATDDALIEQIAQRVIERVSDGVKDTVLDVTERLVRQEIERIKPHVR